MGTLWIPIIVIIFVLCFIMLHQARYVDQCRFFPPYFFNPPTPFFGSSRIDADAAPHIPALTGKIRVPNTAQGDRIVPGMSSAPFEWIPEKTASYS